MHALRVDQLTVRFQGAKESALEEISFALEPGQIAMVVGPNGSGKTTLLRSVLGLIPATGSIEIFGHPAAEAYSMVGYVPQHLRFDMTLPITGAEMLRLAQRFHPRASEMLPWAIETFELAPFLRQPLGTLSGGQLKRLFLARALLHKPPLLLMDEPEAGVDTGGTQRLYQLLETLVAEQQLTALVISHELGIVLRVATQVICLNRRVHCVGAPGDLLTPQTIFELYGPSATLISHDHDQ